VTLASNHPYRLIVFDWDGTLIDSEARIVACMEEAIDRVGLPSRSRAELRNIIGLGLKEALHSLFPDLDAERAAALTEAYRDEFLVRNPTPQAPFRGAEAVLQWLAEEGFVLAVATGKARGGLRRAFVETGFGDYFRASRCADETRSKPDPLMLREIMAEVGVAPERTLMVGDTEYDMQMASRAGTAALAVRYGVHACERLLDWQPVGCLDDIEALRLWLADGAAAAELPPRSGR
jgi:phosphoglycolate phosphatase